jgi:hypothetical protein
VLENVQRMNVMRGALGGPMRRLKLIMDPDADPKA